MTSTRKCVTPLFIDVTSASCSVAPSVSIVELEVCDTVAPRKVETSNACTVLSTLGTDFVSFVEPSPLVAVNESGSKVSEMFDTSSTCTNPGLSVVKLDEKGLPDYRSDD